ncbi:MAG TPA: phosphoribosylglycinamide formyltransferase [Gammaproteobacteria bacterium]
MPLQESGKPGTKLKIVVLISGNGSNLQALIDAAATPGCAFDIAAVISNRDDAFGLHRAQRADIPHHCIAHRAFPDRDAFDQAMIETIDRYQPGLIVLAGFMRILTPAFIRHYRDRMLNIHPSLLPKYRGLHTHQRALEAGDALHGMSIHFVTEELDSGPVVLQAELSIQPEDTPDGLAARVQHLEHIYYPRVVDWYAAGRLRMAGNLAVFDGQPLEKPLYYRPAHEPLQNNG